jgi:hypothetical protein
MELDVADVEGDGRLVEVDGVIGVASKDPSGVATRSPSKDR